MFDALIEKFEKLIEGIHVKLDILIAKMEEVSRMDMSSDSTFVFEEASANL